MSHMCMYLCNYCFNERYVGIAIRYSMSNHCSGVGSVFTTSTKHSFRYF